MSATIIQEQAFNDGTAQNPSAVFTAGTPTVAGHSLIVLAACVTKTRTISSISDSATNTWVHIDGGGSSSDGYCDVWWVPSAASITTFQLHYSGTTKSDLVFIEVSGLAGTVNAHHTTPHTAASTTATESVTTTGSGSTFLVAGLGATSAATAISGAITSIDMVAGGAGLNVAVGHASVAGAATYSVTYTSPSQVSRTTMVALNIASSAVSGIASNVTSAPGAATGTVHNHLFSGTASSPVPAPGVANGVATHHLFSGTASGPTAAPGVANGVASTHAVHGVATGATAAPGAATGAASRHLFAGTASGPTAAPGHATGVASTHTVSGSASSLVTTGQVAVGQALGGVKSVYRRRPRPSVQ